MTITDNGIGLPQDRESLLKPYITHRAKGTGLGLAIVKKLLKNILEKYRLLTLPKAARKSLFYFIA